MRMSGQHGYERFGSVSQSFPAPDHDWDLSPEEIYERDLAEVGMDLEDEDLDQWAYGDELDEEDWSE